MAKEEGISEQTLYNWRKQAKERGAGWVYGQHQLSAEGGCAAESPLHLVAQHPDPDCKRGAPDRVVG
ncbi:MAG: hypothetical protein KZQ95_06100 [Candidatus Thiodiazotropha sp. (ex Epidulcina cf. delphinae)]|nr:hypothetical protein [Candidatus Thiodiazotropha sp. (ex Epidulcina cf. delphinae)]